MSDTVFAKLYIKFNTASQTHTNNIGNFSYLYYLQSDESSRRHCLEGGKCFFQDMKGNFRIQRIMRKAPAQRFKPLLTIKQVRYS